MPSFNQVTLLGNLTRDPEIKYTPKGTPMAEFGLAMNRRWRDEQGEQMEETTFVDCVAWSRSAEVIAEYCQKGNPLFISGRLKLDTWDDKQTGQKRSKLRVIVEEFQLIGGKRDDDEQGGRPSSHGSGSGYRGSTQRQQPPARPPAKQAPRPPKDPDLDVSDDDIPF